MKNQNIRYRRIIPAIVLVLGISCFALPRAAQASGPSIVGLWRVHYFSGGAEVFQSFDQWHSDGQEFEISNIFGLSCQGTFKVRPNGAVELFHVGWLFDQNGVLTGYFHETQTNTVGPQGNRYSGTWHEKDYDVNGNLVNEFGGKLTATRLTVH